MCVCMCGVCVVFVCVCVCKELRGLRIIGNWASSMDQFWTRQLVLNEPIFDWLSRTGLHLNEIFEPKVGQLKAQQMRASCKEFTTVNYNREKGILNVLKTQQLIWPNAMTVCRMTNDRKTLLLVWFMIFQQ